MLTVELSIYQLEDVLLENPSRDWCLELCQLETKRQRRKKAGEEIIYNCGDDDGDKSSGLKKVS